MNRALSVSESDSGAMRLTSYIGAMDEPTALPRKRLGETFLPYWLRLTPTQAARLAMAAHFMGVLPQGFFSHYVGIDPNEPDEDEAPIRVQRKDTPHWLRDELLLAQDGRCGVCGAADSPFHMDHKLPISRGGTHDRYNLWMLCQRCNLQKHDKTVEEFLEWRLSRYVA